VVLRPVHMGRLAEAVGEGSRDGVRMRTAMAHAMALGVQQ